MTQSQHQIFIILSQLRNNITMFEDAIPKIANKIICLGELLAILSETTVLIVS